MKFLNLIKKHWKASSALVAIVILTVIFVVIVKASTVQLTVNLASINFTEGQNSQAITKKTYSSGCNKVLQRGIFTRKLFSCSF